MKHRTMAGAAAALGLARQNLYRKSLASNRKLGHQLSARPRAAGQRITPTRFGQLVLDAIETVCAFAEPAND